MHNIGASTKILREKANIIKNVSMTSTSTFQIYTTGVSTRRLRGSTGKKKSSSILFSCLTLVLQTPGGLCSSIFTSAAFDPPHLSLRKCSVLFHILTRLLQLYKKELDPT